MPTTVKCVVFAAIVTLTSPLLAFNDPASRFRVVTNVADLGAPLAGSVYYCLHCFATAPCTGDGGSGAFAYRVGSAWNCNTGAPSSASAQVNLQSSTPGSAQTGNLNISGTAIAGAFTGNLTGNVVGNASTANGATGNFTIGGNLLFATNGSIATDGATWTIADVVDGISFILDLNSLGVTQRTISIPDASGFFVLDVATQTLTNKTMGATPFTGAITPSQTDGIVGTTTNNNANTGSVGEFVSVTVAPPNTTSLTTGTSANVNTGFSLGAGDWDCWGMVNFTFGATTSITNLAGGISTTSATLPAQDSYFDYETSAMVPTGTAVATWVVPTVRLSNSGSTNVFLVAQATFSVSTIKVGGTIRCRRMR